MQPINLTELKGHIQRLQHSFNRRLETRHGETYRLEHDPFLGEIVYLRLARNSCTVETASDRGSHDTCGILATKDTRRLLCSFMEGWKRSGKERFQFDKVAMTFFLEFPDANAVTSRQLFRLEWDNWLDQNPPTIAAYPHWQFDRWLTASDGRELDQLRNSFRTSEVEIVFESAEQQLETEDRRSRPNLSWFTRIHFPSIAPWATSPLQDDARKPPSHRSMPNSVSELEGWIESSLRYLNAEFMEHA